MIRYAELVQYTKDNHINWNTDLFTVLKGFFEEREKPKIQPSPTPGYKATTATIFNEPKDGEYTDQDVINIFST